MLLQLERSNQPVISLIELKLQIPTRRPNPVFDWRESQVESDTTSCINLVTLLLYNLWGQRQTIELKIGCQQNRKCFSELQASQSEILSIINNCYCFEYTWQVDTDIHCYFRYLSLRWVAWFWKTFASAWPLFAVRTRDVVHHSTESFAALQPLMIANPTKLSSSNPKHHPEALASPKSSLWTLQTLSSNLCKVPLLVMHQPSCPYNTSL